MCRSLLVFGNITGYGLESGKFSNGYMDANADLVSNPLPEGYMDSNFEFDAPQWQNLDLGYVKVVSYDDY
jgi:hypothetical protein